MNTSLKRLLGGLGFVVVGWLALSFIPAPIVPVVWQAPPNPGLTGVFAINQNLANVETVTMPDLGPEDVACSNDGWLYSGLDDGRIVRFNDQGETAPFAQTEGIPLYDLRPAGRANRC